MTKKATKELPLFNGVSLSKIEIEQNGDLHVEFDLPTEKHSVNYRTDVVGKRSFDLYEDAELREAAGKLFKLLKARIEVPDRHRVAINCMKCHESRCCREYAVSVTDQDIAQLAKFLNVSPAAVKRDHLTPMVDWTDDFHFELAKEKDSHGDKCTFLKRDDASGAMRCSVYSARPTLCRDFQEQDCVLFDDEGRLT